MDLYQKSFPFHEQRPPSSQAQIMGQGEYLFYAIYEEKEWIGLLLCWETKKFIYVEHFCIDPEKRNQKYGQRALRLLCRQGKTVILEIDPPIDEVSLRRKDFYERAGFQANSFAHLHPPYHEGFSGHPLLVMSYPERLSEAEYHQFNRYLKDTVMRF